MENKICHCLQLIEKISDPCNAKKHYQPFIRKKNTKSVKKSEIITYQPTIFEKLNIIDIKSVITEHPKTLHKLPKTLRQTKKIASNSSLYSDTKNRMKTFLKSWPEKKVKQKIRKNNKTSTCFWRFCKFL